MSTPTFPSTWQERHDIEWGSMRRLQEQLRALDKQRDALRVQLADMSLLVGRDRPFGILGTEQEAAWLAREQEKVNRRASRRAWEMATLGYHFAPGPWDEDLDQYHGAEATHTWNLGDGYTGRVQRNYEGTWNGYVILPASHWACGRDYDEVAGAVGWNLTYGEGQTFGYDHMNMHDVKPRTDLAYNHADDFGGKRQITRAIRLPSFAPIDYLSRDDVKAEVAKLKAKFMAATDPQVPQPPPLEEPPALGPAAAGPLLDESGEPVCIPRLAQVVRA